MAGKPTIRPATAEDAPAILAIYGPMVQQTAVSFELNVPSLDEFRCRIEQVQLTDPWLVAQAPGSDSDKGQGSDRGQGGAIMGYAYASQFRARPAYAATRETTVYVNPDHHGAGVGRHLMVELLDELRRRGQRLAVAGIVLPNDASIGLHESLGYRPVGTFTDVGHKLGRWHDIGFWQLPLQSEGAEEADQSRSSASRSSR